MRKPLHLSLLRVSDGLREKKYAWRFRARKNPTKPFLFQLTWDSGCLHNRMTQRRSHGWRRPAVVRGMTRTGFQGWGVVCVSHRTVRENLVVVCRGKTSTAETCTELQTMLLMLMGFLWALLLLLVVIHLTEPQCCARMFRFVRRPVPVPVHRPARRFLSSALPWWYYPINAPPGQAERTQCRRSRLPCR